MTRVSPTLALLLALLPATGFGQTTLPTPKQAPEVQQVPPGTPQPSTLPAPSAEPPLSPRLMPVFPPLAAPVPEVPAPQPQPLPLGPDFILTGDCLYWWNKSVPAPVLLTSSLKTQDQGILGKPTTVVLTGNGGIEMAPLSGGRFGLRYLWDRDMGVNFGMFYTSNHGRTYNYVGTTLAVPYFDPVTQQNASLLLSQPGSNTGYAGIEVYGRLWNMEINLLLPQPTDPLAPVEILAGLRYMQLEESLRLRTLTTLTATGYLAGTATPAGSTYAGTDSFITRNHFMGTQAGAHGRWRWNEWSVDASMMVGIGTTNQQVIITGFTNLNVPSTGNALGNVFTQETNVGKTSRRAFAFLPQGQLKFGYQMCEQIRAFAGVDALYWNSVVRPASQLDPQVNPSLIPLLDSGNHAGPSRPTAQFSRSDYWAIGFNFGLDVVF